MSGQSTRINKRNRQEKKRAPSTKEKRDAHKSRRPTCQQECKKSKRCIMCLARVHIRAHTSIHMPSFYRQHKRSFGGVEDAVDHVRGPPEGETRLHKHHCHRSPQQDSQVGANALIYIYIYIYT